MSAPFDVISLPERPAFRFVQIYGERCSGTNVLIRLIENNVTSARFTERFGFKHWFVPERLVLPEDTLGILIEREPRAWLRSLHEKAWHHPAAIKDLPFTGYLRHEWRCVWDDHWLGVDDRHPQWASEMMHERDPATGERLSDPLALREAKSRNWHALGARSPAFLRLAYEDLRADQAAVLCALDRIGLSLGPYHPIESYKGEGGQAFVPKERPPLDAEDDAYIECRFREMTPFRACSQRGKR